MYHSSRLGRMCRKLLSGNNGKEGWMRRVMHRFPSKHTEEEEEIQREWRGRAKTGGQGPVGGGGWGFVGACGGLEGAGRGRRGQGLIPIDRPGSSFFPRVKQETP